MELLMGSLQVNKTVTNIEWNYKWDNLPKPSIMRIPNGRKIDNAREARYLNRIFKQNKLYNQKTRGDAENDRRGKKSKISHF